MVWDSSFNCDLDQEQRMGVGVGSPHRAAAQSSMENSYCCAISSLGWNRCRFVCTFLHLDAADGFRWNRRLTNYGSAHGGGTASTDKSIAGADRHWAIAIGGLRSLPAGDISS